MFNNKKAEMGMGTLIIFIALILVAAIAASVLISTTGTLQNKALATGKDTTKEVGTSMKVLQVYAEDGSDQDIEEFTEVIKLNAGSDPIRFSDLLLSVDLNNATGDYTYSDTVNCSNVSTTTAGGNYGLDYSIEGNNYREGYLNKGDVVRLCFESPRGVIESEDIRIALVPKVGTPNVIETNLPDLMVNTRVRVFP